MTESTSHRTIRLTRGETALVDEGDYDRLSQYRWRLHTDGYAIRSVQRDGRWTTSSMHREILPAAGLEVDHSNGNPLDNRRMNLRVATSGQNKANTRRSRRNTSGFKGVSWAKERNKWLARLTINSHRIHIGYFETAEAASKAYDAKAVEVFGPFARLNSTEEVA